VLATASTLTDRCSTSIKRAAQYHSALTVELSANLGLPMFVATVAARRHMPRELVLKKPMYRVSFSRDS
jgi:hypothetical protein